MAKAKAKDITIWTNPRCSKCRGAEALLADAGVDVTRIRYLDEPPSRNEIERVLALTGESDPRTMMRTGEPIYRELNLDQKSGSALIDAMAQHPILIERPIIIKPDAAIIARPPELLLDFI